MTCKLGDYISGLRNPLCLSFPLEELKKLNFNHCRGSLPHTPGPLAGLAKPSLDCTQAWTEAEVGACGMSSVLEGI